MKFYSFNRANIWLASCTRIGAKRGSSMRSCKPATGGPCLKRWRICPWEDEFSPRFCPAATAGVQDSQPQTLLLNSPGPETQALDFLQHTVVVHNVLIWIPNLRYCHGDGASAWLCS